jgi:uncharacterized membrane protein YdbT with pleckstrin-like domain
MQQRDTIQSEEFGTVSELTIYPTGKFIKAGALLAAIVFLALEAGCLLSWNAVVGPLVMAVPLLVLIWPAMRWLRRRLTKATIGGERLRYETGLLTKSTRTIQLPKVQDVRVDQSLFQRLVNVGDLSIETAGEASRLTVHNVDDPQALADEILNRAQKGAATA